MRQAIALIIVVVFWFGIPQAKDDGVSLRRVDIVGATPTTDRTGACLVGNFETPAWIVEDWFTGDERYWLLFDPAADCDCPTGFSAVQASIYLQFPGSGQIQPALRFSVIVNLVRATWRNDLQCWWPGTGICVSGPHEVVVSWAGMYAFSVPFDCDCEDAASPGESRSGI